MACVKTIFLIASLLVTLGFAIPPPIPDENGEPTEIKFESVDETVDRENSTHAQFRYVWIDQRGYEYPSYRPGLMEVSATRGVTAYGFKLSTYILKVMLRAMPSFIFQTLASRGKAGVFTRQEKITTFPEYARHRDTPQCRGRCTGSCQITCTFDGRKYDTLAGVGGSRGVAVEDNILCNQYDPYRGNMNVMVHEFTHTIHGYALSSDLKARIDTAWRRARQAGTWTRGSYALATVFEYFAEGAGVFFHTDKYLSANGGMSNCFGKGYCRDESDARRWLQYRDPALFSLLNYVFTGNSGVMSGFRGPCL